MVVAILIDKTDLMRIITLYKVNVLQAAKHHMNKF